MQPSTARRSARILTLAAGLAVVGAGLLIADTLNRPLDVQLRTRIDLYQQNEDGDWTKIDEIGPESVEFEATLLEMARANRVGTDFVFQTRTRNGRDYSVRLVDPADVSFNPMSGRFDAELTFEVMLDGQRARVSARPTTETRSGPVGTLRGRRAEGVLGRSPTVVTLVSANELQLPGAAPMLLVSEEEYRLIPRRRR